MQSKINLHFSTNFFGSIVQKNPVNKVQKNYNRVYVGSIFMPSTSNKRMKSVVSLGKAERKSKYKVQGREYLLLPPFAYVCRFVGTCNFHKFSTWMMESV